jgi:hypothetical protein
MLVMRSVIGSTTLGSEASVAKLACLTQLVFAVLLGTVASVAPEPGFLPRGMVLFVGFGMPAAVGALGVARMRPALLCAAGLTSFAGAFVAFSGVTLIFLFPAVLFLYGAVQVQVAEPHARHGSLLGGILRGTAALAIVVMLLGAGAAALLITDEGCWAEYRGPNAGLTFMPYMAHEIALPSGASSVTCSTGIMSPRGVGLAVLLWAGALLLAERSSRRRDEPYVSGSGTHWPSATPTATNSG